jgi:Transposase DDE domain
VAAASGVRVGGLLVCAIDGTTLAVADTPVNHGVYRHQPGHHGGSGYLLLRLVALVACGTRSLIDVVFGPLAAGETTMTNQLIQHLHAGMLVLCDRNLTTAALTRRIAATDAHLLGRCKANRQLPVVGRLPDGSWLSLLGGVQVRVVDAEITIATSAGRATASYRLATTLTDPHAWPAATLVALDHQRWEIETAYLELKSSILGGRVLRARTPQGIDQEVHALLVCYQLLRLAMADATSTQPGIDPDRASFTIALQAARDQLIQAAGVLATTTVDLAGTIGRAVLDNLLADRRLRVSPRIVKRAISKYNARGPTINRPATRPPSASTSSRRPPDLTTSAGPNYPALGLGDQAIRTVVASSWDPLRWAVGGGRDGERLIFRRPRL